ncbi:RpiR family transcriptional regulator [Breoghania corrubedonensis]|uniref:RpiR family transcriptional regulator n=1 Tax=Breoghania corrubedonensis TaxID=665038 RepID=A0A2T5VDZ9_9HYPH|nr:MurR/RpiR family transcriptional regulator [Breoghania corrubedonensis]PTW61978.1 RpiR family transcriptional regulator [Breoghania corrubedonensis]
MTAQTRGQETVAEAIRAGLHALTATEQKAARTLLAGYPVTGLETVAEFARRASVSAPTILRFVAKLGFDSYPDFQRALRAELNAQLATPLAKRDAPPQRPDSGDSAFLERFRSALADNLAQTFAHLPGGEFEATVQLLAQTRGQVYVIGGRFTDALARYLSAHLRIVRPGVVQMAGQADNWRDQLLDMSRKDLLIVFDIRRYSEDLARFSAAAAKRSVPVVLLTDQWLSPIAAHARHVLSARVAAPSNWDSSVALLGLAEALVAGTTEALWDSARPRIDALEEMRGD